MSRKRSSSSLGSVPAPLPSGAVCVGIDVCKAWLDVALWPSSEAGWRVPQEPEALAGLVERLRPLAPARIVLESTGGWEQAVAAELAAAGLPVVIVNPQQARAFAQGMGQRAKTDALDARMLARLAATAPLRVSPLPSAEQQALRALVERRRQLLGMRQAERNRLVSVPVAAPTVRAHIEAHLAWLDEQLTALEAEIGEHIATSPIWQAMCDLLMSVPGIGPAVAHTLVAELPELGTLTHKHLASLVGVVPYPHESGTKRKRRPIQGGRATVRSALYMATMVAVRFNEQVRFYYQHLIGKGGKEKKVALVACMHKLLRMLNAMVHHQTPWEDRPLPVLA